MRADGRTDMATLKIAFRSFAKNHLTNRKDEHPCSELVSNSQSQQLGERRHTVDRTTTGIGHDKLLKYFTLKYMDGNFFKAWE
jgi:hypothetical protein